MDKGRIYAIRDRAYRNLTECILPFWTSDFILDEENGGFVGLVTLNMEKDPKADRALVLTGRMVFALSKSYILTKNPLCLDRAKRAFYYLVDHFYDKEYGLAYSTVNYKGEPVSTDKPLYGEAFFVMACGSYYEASGDPLAKELGLAAFKLIEEKYKVGPAAYSNGFVRDFSAPADMFGGRRPRGGGFSMPEGTVMFQHHLCQSYEHLYRATRDPEVGKALLQFAEYIPNMLYDAKYHCFKSILDKDGNRIGLRQSFGHDAEISYLAMDIAELVGDEALIAKTKAVVSDVCLTLLERDFDQYGALINSYDFETGQHDEIRTWWVEAEAGTSLMCGYQLTGDDRFLTAEEKLQTYIENYFVNKANGDWYNNVIVDDAGGRVVDGMHGFDKLNPGKCPFHNTHMCLELVRRCNLLVGE